VVLDFRLQFVVNFNPLNLAENDIFSWGNNSFGQLGQGDTKNRSIPTKIDFFNGKKILQIACGDYHCLALESMINLIQSSR
jgi:alpha-tubulin suppressor-like RCC1 family protein